MAQDTRNPVAMLGGCNRVSNSARSNNRNSALSQFGTCVKNNGSCTSSRKKRETHYFCFRFSEVEEVCAVKGRNAWALGELMRAGSKGVTPIDNPAPRWSAYIYNLRTEYGLDIETVNEPHGGDYPGTHARYVLRTFVEVVE